ncbi:RNA recognition motif domain,Acin1, RNSP1-SAP18 binding (RSB) motif,Acinus, RNA recognition motif [Cinara cedri]|uniref:RNA recognition motif domain,Acin1, RNSP1-SAP18 binding (RSB) motif,Acinus, RNA recognition motif n=1 Tax=Cinara cedri TaxID=506608 RepID=A0A5E4MVK2_9HEMI|nr:RNA recognition motif domain,Acin1, RNSP1-SAP18 binding (RSB) motif,Acinus, RNA recognition motif [Cinara cedri]
MSKRTGRKPKRERTSRRRTRRHSSTSDTSSEDVPPKPSKTRARASSRVDETEKKVALTIKLPKPETTTASDENTTGMWKVECSNGSDGDIQKLKISLRRSPKDLLREQAAEAKYSAERKAAEEAAGSSTNTSILDGSVTTYLEQFGSTVAVEETEENLVDCNEQVQIVIPTNESSCNQGSLSKIDDQVGSGEMSSEITDPKEEPVIENISTDNNKLIDEVSETIVVITNDICEETIETTNIVESINLSEYCPDSTVHSSIHQCEIPENCLKEESVSITEIISSDIAEVVPPDVDLPINEKVQDAESEETIETEIIHSNTSELLLEENVSTVEINITANDVLEESHKNDIIDSEQMEDVVQLTVESPDLVDDEDPKPIDDEDPKPIDDEDPKPIDDEEEPKSVDDEEESKSVDDEEESKSVDDEEESKLVDKNEESKLVDKKELESVDKELQPVDEEKSKLENVDEIDNEGESLLVIEEKDSQTVESCPMTSEIPQLKHVENDMKLDETPKSLHPKRKWGSCKTRTPILISPFTLGTIIESNGNSIDDNGDYRSEEGEIQKTDSDEEQYFEEPMEMNDTMLIDHEAVDYEAPEEEDKPDNENDDSKSDKSLAEEINEIDTKKKLSAKRMITSNVIHITNLVRPFTVGQLRDLLQRTGKIVTNGFWIDTIKSECIVEYENEDQAIETVYALNESQWPSTNPKVLKVVFTDKEELNKALNGAHPVRLEKQKESKVEKLRTQLENHTILREWDRGKLEDMNGEKEDKPVKRKTSDDSYVLKDKKIKKDEKDLQEKRKKSKSKTPERIPTKSLDELFRKTKTTPTLYWSPLSTEQIAEKEDQRRKHLAEMERSQKTDRRRRDINHYPRRR